MPATAIAPQIPPYRKRHDLLWYLVATVILVFGHIFITFPAWQDPLTRLPGPTGDNCMMVWNLGWVKHALDHGGAGFWCTATFNPTGFLFIYGSHTWLDGALYWMMSWLLPSGYRGGILWANLTLLAATVLTGLFAISALRAWGIGHWPVVIMAACGLAFSWFRMFAVMGHYNFTGTHWMMIAVCLLSWARVAYSNGIPRRGHLLAAGGGFFLGCAALNEPTMAIFAAVLSVIIFYSLLRPPFRPIILGALLFFGVAAIVAGLHLVPILRAALAGRLDYYRVDTSYARLVDISSFVLPNDYHLLGQWLKPFRERTGFGWAEGTYLGVIPMVLLLTATFGSLHFVFRRRSEFRLCFHATVVAWGLLIIAMGDKLMLGGDVYFTLPGRILREIPLVNNLRVPQRWVWPAHLAIILAGTSAITGWLKTRPVALTLDRRRLFLTFLPLMAAFIAILEGRSYPYPEPVDYASEAMQPPGMIQGIRSAYEGGTVLTMPVEITYAQANVVQYLTGYDIPMAISYMARMPMDVNQLPWKWAAWTPETASWLKNHNVQIVYFPFHDVRPEEFADWISQARSSVSGLIVLNKHGQEI